MYWLSSNGRLSIHFTLKQAQSASHSGSCDNDVLALSKLPIIARQLKAFDPTLNQACYWNNATQKYQHHAPIALDSFAAVPAR